MRFRTLSFVVLLVFTVQGASAEAAEDAAAPGNETRVGAELYSADDVGRMREGDAIHLSLLEAVRLGLQNNLSIEIQRYEPLFAEQDKVGAWGTYDPEAYGEIGYRSDDALPANIFAPTGETLTETVFDGILGLKGVLPYLGTSYDLTFGSRQTETNSAFPVFSPEQVPAYGMTFTQPLLKGLIWNEPWTRISTTRVAYQTSLENFRRDVMDTVQGIENSYWDLIAAQEQKRVDIKSLETSKALLDQVNTQFEVGVVSKVEVVEAEAGVAEREFNLIRSENAYENEQDDLYDLIYGTKMMARTDPRIEPTEDPENYVLFEVSREASVQMAFGMRPELAAARNEIERQEYELKFAKNQWLPRVDAVVGYGNSGLAGDPNPFAPPPTPPATTPSAIDYGDAWQRAGDTGEWSVRGLLSYPIGNRAAGSAVSKTQLALRRTHTTLKRQEQAIIIEVRRSVRALKSAQEGIEASERRRLAAEEQLRAERIRLEYGESTPFDVLQRERDLVDAESEKISALQIYRQATTGLARAQGTILRDRNIVIEDVARLR